MPITIFDEEHISFIKRLLNRVPPQQLIASFLERYPTYTHKQVRSKLDNLLGTGNTSLPTIGCWSTAYLARTLGINYYRVDSWRQRGLVTLTQDSTSARHIRYFVTKKGFEDFAINKPQLLRGIESKKIRKLTKNKKVFEAIADYLKKPHPKDIVIIKLNDGQVFESAKQASAMIGCVVTDKGILYNCSSDRPMVNGMDWYKLQYPCFEVPGAIKKEFLYWSGLVFYELYQDLVNIEGYKKSCLVVAARNAVQIALFTYRRQAREAQDNKTLTPRAELIEYYKKGVIDRIKKLYNKVESDCWRSVKKAIENNVAPVVSKRTSGTDVNFVVEEIAMIIIERRHKSFYQKQFLPSGYNPQSRLEKADYFQSIYASAIYSSIDFKDGRRIRACIVEAIAFLNKIKPTTGYIDEIKAPDTEKQVTTEIEEILTQVDALDISDEQKQEVRRQVESFLDSDGEIKVAPEIMQILKRAALPF